MDIKSISGITCYVKSLDITSKFYEDLGFRPGKRAGNHAIFYVNWFWVEFVEAGGEDKPEFQAEANAKHKGAGTYFGINVANVDDFYKGVVAKGMNPSSKPQDWSRGRREFVLRDPDGYKLVFFQKI